MDGKDVRGQTVLCDFDGTITLIDTAEYLLDRFADGDWKAVERLLEEGRITIEECMARQFEMVMMPREAIVKELDRVAEVRPGFVDLVERCHCEGVRLRITSAGLDFYIRHFLEARGWSEHIDVVAPQVTESGGRINFAFPPHRFREAKNFKEDNVLREQHIGHRVAYIGDGVSDGWAALAADAAFAVKGSKLDRLLDRKQKEHRSFSDFYEVMSALFP